MIYKKINKCRLCGSKKLKKILSLGNQYLSGVFPKKGQKVHKAPLSLVKCMGKCGLLQLEHTVKKEYLFGEEYGYRSGINSTMRSHLNYITKLASSLTDIQPNDYVLDIGSNDGTLLSNYPIQYYGVGVDPSINNFIRYYEPRFKRIKGFFDRKLLKSFPKFKVITSIAMLYDLDNPIKFAKDIYECLNKNGVWVTEQSYLPFMIENSSFDTICHEHVAYYGLRQLEYIANRTGFKVEKIEKNNINGGSILVAFKKGKNSTLSDDISFDKLQKFKDKIQKTRDSIVKFINQELKCGKKIFGYGASTKGNVILQYCKLNNKKIPFIADRNPEKWGRYTPGTKIKIISERDARDMKPDYFLVLPWHFAEEIKEREMKFLLNGGKLIFPLRKEN